MAAASAFSSCGATPTPDPDRGSACNRGQGLATVSSVTKEPRSKPVKSQPAQPGEVAAASAPSPWGWRSERWIKIAVPTLLAGCIFVMLRWTWLRWADITVDFGRELYTPWQLSQGRVLYRDVAAFYGPLSQYFNAFVFWLFGPSYRALVFTNLAIMVGLLALIYPLLRQLSSRLAATVACVVFVLFFAFAQHLPGIANYNYVSPYSHEALHGLVLSLLAMFFLMQYQRRGSWWWAGACGCSLGMVLLTKPESLVAAAPAVIGGLALSAWIVRLTVGRVLITITAFVAAALVPLIVAWWLLSTALPSDVALRGVLGSWPYLFDDRLTSLPFFKINMGTDDVGKNVWELLKMAGWYLLAIVPAVLAGLMMRGGGIAPRIVAAIGAAAVPAALWRLGNESEQWGNFARPLPAVLLLAWTFIIIGLLRGRGADAKAQLQRVLRLALITFAGLLLLKMALFTRIAHYGFILAMPATLLTIVMLMDWLPAWVRKWGGSGLVVKAAAFVAIAMVVHVHLRQMDKWLDFRQFELPRGADTMMLDGFRGAPISSVLSRMSEIIEPGQTLVVMPEGVMLNYLLRMDNPTQYLTFLPSDIIMFGERPMLDALRNNPPDYIALVHRSTAEYGPAFFGVDYARDLHDWVISNYQSVGLAGQAPFQPGTHFGVRVMRRFDVQPSSTAGPAGP